ncbi:acyltransferase [Mucilaginibacter sp. PAMB04274]|uniref:acyltransferase family protein n=1 Tax=Mucilaginibacter sp. PAMB04274 TaxID=3138568 RepID=UPI0031F5F508
MTQTQDPAPRAEPLLISEKRSPALHLNFLDGLRAITALYVVLHHAFRELPVNTNPYVKLVTYPFRFGGAGVAVFIVLSGFCLMIPVARNNSKLKDSTGKFLIKRAKRILPTYYLAMLFALIMFYTVVGNDTTTHWKGMGPVSYKDIITHILLIHNIFYDTSRTINYCFWSIAVEWYIYFLFPIIVFFWRKFNAVKTTLATVLIAALIQVFLSRFQENLNVKFISPIFIGLFGLGMFAAHVSFSNNKSLTFLKNFRYWPVVLLITFMLFLSGHFAHSFYQKIEGPLLTSGSLLPTIYTGLFASSLLIALSTNKLIGFRKFLSLKPLVSIGTFAYSIYLIHAPLIEVVMRYVILPLNMGIIANLIILTFAGGAFIITVSYGFYLIAEKPFLNTKRASATTSDAVQPLAVS